MHAFYTVNVAFDPSQSITKYTNKFEVRLACLYGYTTNANPIPGCYKANYRRLLVNDKYKRDCLLSALVKHYPNVVDNLITKEDLSYEDLKERLISLSSNGQLNGYDGGNNTSGSNGNGNTSTALVVAGKGNNKNKKKKGQQGQQAQQAQTPGTKECSYCKCHGGRYKGHNWQDCRTLKRDQIKKKKNADAQIAETQSSFAYAEGFITDVSSQLQNDGIHSWKFDTCAISYITSDIGKFHTITPQAGVVRVGGNNFLPVEGIGSVIHNTTLPDGTTSNLRLDTVLYHTARASGSSRACGSAPTVIGTGYLRGNHSTSS